MKTNKSIKQQKASYLNSIVAGHISPASLVHRPYTKHVGYGEGKDGYRFNDTGELVPMETVLLDIENLKHSKGGMKFKFVSYGKEDE